MVLEYTLTRREAKSAAHAAVLAAPFPAWRAARWGLSLLSIATLSVGLTFLVRGEDGSASSYLLAAYASLLLLIVLPRMLTGTLGLRPAKACSFHLDLGPEGMNYRGPSGVGSIAPHDLLYRDTATALILYSRTRHQAVPVVKSKLRPAELLDLQATLAELPTTA